MQAVWINPVGCKFESSGLPVVFLSFPKTDTCFSSLLLAAPASIPIIQCIYTGSGNNRLVGTGDLNAFKTTFGSISDAVNLVLVPLP
jgi:hypothetical protein